MLIVAEDHIQRALSELTNSDKDSSDFTQPLYFMLAKIDYESGKYRQSLDRANWLLQEALDYFGPEHPSLATVFYFVALCYEKLDDVKNAREKFDQALQFQQSAVGSNKPTLTSMLLDRAEFEHELGMYNESRNYLKKAYAGFDERNNSDSLKDRHITLEHSLSRRFPK